MTLEPRPALAEAARTGGAQSLPGAGHSPRGGFRPGHQIGRPPFRRANRVDQPRGPRAVVVQVMRRYRRNADRPGRGVLRLHDHARRRFHRAGRLGGPAILRPSPRRGRARDAFLRRCAAHFPGRFPPGFAVSDRSRRAPLQSGTGRDLAGSGGHGDGSPGSSPVGRAGRLRSLRTPERRGAPDGRAGRRARRHHYHQPRGTGDRTQPGG